MNTTLNPDPLVRFLGKPRAAFTRSDIVRYVRENGIEMINLLLDREADRRERYAQILSKKIGLDGGL